MAAIQHDGKAFKNMFWLAPLSLPNCMRRNTVWFLLRPTHCGIKHLWTRNETCYTDKPDKIIQQSCGENSAFDRGSITSWRRKMSRITGPLWGESSVTSVGILMKFSSLSAMEVFNPVQPVAKISSI